MKRIKRHIPLYISVFLLLATVLIYLLFCRDDDVGITSIVGTVLAIVAGIAFWIEFYHNNKVNEASFIMELNHQFITNPNMTSVEHCLERYYALLKNGGAEEERQQYLEQMRRTYAISNLERQHLVNYLVYLESIAALINTGVIKLRTINDLMAYRYFIAVNNPVVQELELFPYREFYHGCFDIYPEWKKTIHTMPLTESPLIPEKEK